MPLAVEQIRRMRGGAQAQLMRCADGGFYVVKFQNNPQGTRILANELLATRIAERLGLATPPAAVIEVKQSLISNSEEMVIQLGRGRSPYKAGLQFGSRYPGSPAEIAVYDFLPEENLRDTSNLGHFCGMLAFDKWTCNTNGRQAIFFRRPGETRYEAQMIDNGFCFNAGEWNFPDAPLRGLYGRHCVYERVGGMDAFEPWLARIDKMDASILGGIAEGIPPEWFDFAFDALEKMIQHLARRRTLVRELIISAWKSSAQPFRHWTASEVKRA
jgi:hypothetical protein